MPGNTSRASNVQAHHAHNCQPIALACNSWPEAAIEIHRVVFTPALHVDISPAKAGGSWGRVVDNPDITSFSSSFLFDGYPTGMPVFSGDDLRVSNDSSELSRNPMAAVGVKNLISCPMGMRCYSDTRHVSS